MNKSSSSSRLELIDEKRKLFYYITQCLTENHQFETIDADISELSLMLQLMGFQIQSFEKAPLQNQTSFIQDNNVNTQSAITIQLNCLKSGMKSMLVKQLDVCKCPTQEEEAKSQLWSISGVDPAAREQVHSSYSSLLPKISQAKAKIINGLLSNILKIINRMEVDETKESKHENRNESFFSRSHSLDNLKNHCEASSRGVRRSLSWEVGPPKGASSPIPSLCNSMKEVSISDKDQSVLRNLATIKQLVEETTGLLKGKNSTFTKTGVQKNTTSGYSSRETTPRLTNEKKTTRKILAPKKKLTEDKSQSKIAILRKKTFVASTSSLVSKVSPRVDTGIRSTVRQANATGSHESLFVKRNLRTANYKISSPAGKVSNGTEAGTSGTGAISRGYLLKKPTQLSKQKQK